MATNSTTTDAPGRAEHSPWSRFMTILWKTFLPMNRLHFPIRGRRTSATDEDDLKDPIAALSPSSSSFALVLVLRPRPSSSSFVLCPSMATNSTPTYVPGRTERGSWSQFMSILWKTSLPMNRHNASRFLGSRRKRLSSVASLHPSFRTASVGGFLSSLIDPRCVQVDCECTVGPKGRHSSAQAIGLGTYRRQITRPEGPR